MGEKRGDGADATYATNGTYVIRSPGLLWSTTLWCITPKSPIEARRGSHNVCAAPESTKASWRRVLAKHPRKWLLPFGFERDLLGRATRLEKIIKSTSRTIEASADQTMFQNKNPETWRLDCL